MSGKCSPCQIGQIVLITHGREAGQYAVIVGVVDERFVLLADGSRRTFDVPKRKNVQHIQLLDYISSEVRNSIIETGRVTNGKLRYALTKFANQYVTDSKKGEPIHGEGRCN
ncbi:KOW domain-containing RNA-binding protein [Thermaerobacillus caldiproteolyticus]|uniref:Ribosomal protein L14E/L6E/L27E n=1 Tax=Thermaerobacillus caldiproteolyticus TaxID=247480 RepID=A0A7V9Z9V4_9BACL|nr:KOW domain-containing RNA-binding protein [Anoxybacillus caldiproteolyticus]MBA2876740.1 ribosomal protein L14E/L6E/L27E [Anoxybacillus caldiproteolyticus]QPA31080.1 KOW domain-containing RNA-binding protein [Anoxybacillus caldiproteolyticus]